MSTYGVVALARPTFDVEFAEENKNRAFAALDAAGIATVGPRELLFDGPAVVAAAQAIQSAARIDLLLIIQVTFTDASMTVHLARDIEAPVALWGLPEPRAGGRLRLNAYCGINLAAHALGKAEVDYGWLYLSADAAGIEQRLRDLLQPLPPRDSRISRPGAATDPAAQRVMRALAGSRIGVVGRHPDGFDTCAYDGPALRRLAGVEVESVELETLFARAKAADDDRVAAVRARAQRDLAGLGAVDQAQLDRSLRIYCALQDVQADTGASSLAVRCWPETFTDYGCAACGPMAMMNEAGVPCACEADVYGSLSTLMMQELAQAPVWMADLVDIDAGDDTAVFWHCGLAPLSMCDPEAQPQATIHTNRKMPLLHQFPLKPGRVTLARLSQAKNVTKLIIGGAEMLRAPMAFTGTSGTLRFDRPAAAVCATIMDEGVEHHYAIAYGDYRESLRALAAQMEVPVLELT
ncbi:hypothetical protein FKG94_24700 [Exilibacterium tricleocarpae]|uniref:L-fucose isomerase C-terminal domain-containing protein n=1 Tax=Exilibacterium tricleocarpae TaxID=2591008 RepID=A0A545SS11_9GAMM|nr:hypothetical protein [Exilibacterium tricleocarpae]TQV67735.1 hypothetical protein FKG94_24700 [Exilibacterium tricleocarpae]